MDILFCRHVCAVAWNERASLMDEHANMNLDEPFFNLYSQSFAVGIPTVRVAQFLTCRIPPVFASFRAGGYVNWYGVCTCILGKMRMQGMWVQTS